MIEYSYGLGLHLEGNTEEVLKYFVFWCLEWFYQCEIRWYANSFGLQIPYCARCYAGSSESTEFGMTLRWFSFAVTMLLPRHSVMLVNCMNSLSFSEQCDSCKKVSLLLIGLFPLLFFAGLLTVPPLRTEYSVSVYSKRVPARMLVFIMVIEMC